MTVLAYLYFVIMYRSINSPHHGKNVVNELNAMDKHYLKEKMEIIGKLASNDTSNIGFLPSASKDVSVTFLDQFIRIFDRI